MLPLSSSPAIDPDHDAVLDALLGEIRRITRADAENIATSRRDSPSARAEPPTEPGPDAETVVGFGDPVGRLSRTRAWAGTPEEVLRSLVREAVGRRYRPGERIIVQGDPSDSLFLLLGGVVEIGFADGDGRREVLCRAGRGAVLGELASLTGRPRSASVDAVSAVRALEIPADAVHRAVRAFPTLNATLHGLAGRRLGDRRRDVLTGQALHGYRIEERLGRGGMGVVYRAADRDGRRSRSRCCGTTSCSTPERSAGSAGRPTSPPRSITPGWCASVTPSPPLGRSSW